MGSWVGLGLGFGLGVGSAPRRRRPAHRPPAHRPPAHRPPAHRRAARCPAARRPAARRPAAASPRHRRHGCLAARRPSHNRIVGSSRAVAALENLQNPRGAVGSSRATAAWRVARDVQRGIAHVLRRGNASVCAEREKKSRTTGGCGRGASLTFRFLPLLRPSCTSFSFLANMDVARLAGSKWAVSDERKGGRALGGRVL